MGQYTLQYALQDEGDAEEVIDILEERILQLKKCVTELSFVRDKLCIDVKELIRDNEDLDYCLAEAQIAKNTTYTEIMFVLSIPMEWIFNLPM